jgi:hypothetical protein
MAHLRRALTVLATALLAGCAHQAQQEAQEAPLPTTTVEFDQDGDARTPEAVLSDHKIDLRVFSDHPEPVLRPPTEQGRVYLAFAASTGCRVPTGVEVRRSGDDLHVAFTGGVDRPECFRPIGPSAVLELAAADVAGVRTVNGVAPARI